VLVRLVERYAVPRPANPSGQYLTHRRVDGILIPAGTAPPRVDEVGVEPQSERAGDANVAFGTRGPP
jgi:hypothetical protein